MATVTVDTTKTGTGVETDENGNIIAKVNHRTGTITDLVAVADAGDGELAVSTENNNALIVYENGDINAITRPAEICLALYDVNQGLVIGPSAATEYDIKNGDGINNYLYSPTRHYDPFNDDFDFEDFAAAITPSQIHVRVEVANLNSLGSGFALNDVMTYKLKIYDDNSSTWFTADSTTVVAAGTAAGDAELVSYVFKYFSNSAAHQKTKWKLVWETDTAAAIMVVEGGDIKGQVFYGK